MAAPFPSGGGKRPYFKRRPQYGQGKYRRNERIRVPEVRVIGPDGTQLGVLQTHKALTMAKEADLDLVEVSPTARPPVCRILDYGKFKYEESKKQKGAKTKTTKVKEGKFRLNIDDHDYLTKIRRAEGFLHKGNKYKLTIVLRGREMEHKDLAFEVGKRVISDLEGVATPDSTPRLIGRNISVSLTPLSENKRKLKFNTEGDIADADHEDS